jgi:hypothetical protein
MTLTPYERSRQNNYRVRKFRSRHSDFLSSRPVNTRPDGTQTGRLPTYWQQPRRWLGLRTHAALTQYSLEHTT